MWWIWKLLVEFAFGLEIFLLAIVNFLITDEIGSTMKAALVWSHFSLCLWIGLKKQQSDNANIPNYFSVARQF